MSPNSTKPWSSVCKLNDTTRGARTVPRHCQKTKEWLVPQLLEWSSHSLAYEITQLSKTNHTTFPGHCTLWWLMPCGVCFSLNLNKSTSYLSLCLSPNFFAMRHQEPELLYVLKPGTIGFAQPHVPVGYNGVTNHSTESLPCGFESRS